MTKKIAVIGFSSYSDKDALDKGLAWLRSHGFEITVSEQVYKKHGQSAGTVEDKLHAFENACNDPSIDFIMAAGGGNGAVHLLPHLKLDQCTKPIIGFSDTTSILNVAKHGAIHGMTVERLGRSIDDVQKSHFLNLLNNNVDHIEWSNCDVLREGSTSGRLFGGNLSAFQTLLGTPYMPDCKNAVLFFEDCNEETSRIDRMLGHLANAGVFENAAALIFGQFLNMSDTGKKPYGFDIRNVLARYGVYLSCPVILNAPFGHGEDLWSLPINRNIHLDITPQTTKITFT